MVSVYRNWILVKTGRLYIFSISKELNLLCCGIRTCMWRLLSLVPSKGVSKLDFWRKPDANFLSNESDTRSDFLLMENGEGLNFGLRGMHQKAKVSQFHFVPPTNAQFWGSIYDFSVSLYIHFMDWGCFSQFIIILISKQIRFD